ncbi:MAG: YciI family protein [Gemmatimonadaceae bacterium]
MKYVVLIYNDTEMLSALPAKEFDATMRDCLAHADDLKTKGRLLQSQMLQDPMTAKSIRVRNGRRTISDGPFTEAKEMLGGFNIIEADSMDDAVAIAATFPWASTGCVEVRPVEDIDAVRQRVSATS